MEIPRKNRDKIAKKQSKTTVKDRKRHVKSKSLSESTENDWVKDPRMPHKLNELTSLMWKSRLQELANEQYRHPGPDKILYQNQ